MFQSKNQKVFSYIIFGIYLFLLAWLILFKFNTDLSQLSHMQNINLIPFNGSAVINGRISFSEIIYNILVFVPLGVYVCIFKPDWSFFKKALPAFCLSFLFETLQFIFAIGASDITDVIGNTLGGILGILCFFLFKKTFKNKTIAVINSIGLIFEVIAMILLTVLFIVNH